MIQSKDYQKRAVREQKQKMVDMLYQTDDRQKLVFKAPIYVTTQSWVHDCVVTCS